MSKNGDHLYFRVPILGVQTIFLNHKRGLKKSMQYMSHNGDLISFTSGHIR